MSPKKNTTHRHYGDGADGSACDWWPWGAGFALLVVELPVVVVHHGLLVMTVVVVVVLLLLLLVRKVGFEEVDGLSA